MLWYSELCPCINTIPKASMQLTDGMTRIECYTAAHHKAVTPSHQAFEMFPVVSIVHVLHTKKMHSSTATGCDNGTYHCFIFVVV